MARTLFNDNSYRMTHYFDSNGQFIGYYDSHDSDWDGQPPRMYRDIKTGDYLYEKYRNQISILKVEGDNNWQEVKVFKKMSVSGKGLPNLLVAVQFMDSVITKNMISNL